MQKDFNYGSVKQAENKEKREGEERRDLGWRIKSRGKTLSREKGEENTGI